MMPALTGAVGGGGGGPLVAPALHWSFDSNLNDSVIGATLVRTLGTDDPTLAGGVFSTTHTVHEAAIGAGVLDDTAVVFDAVLQLDSANLTLPILIEDAFGNETTSDFFQASASQLICGTTFSVFLIANISGLVGVQHRYGIIAIAGRFEVWVDGSKVIDGSLAFFNNNSAGCTIRLGATPAFVNNRSLANGWVDNYTWYKTAPSVAEMAILTTPGAPLI